jgi:hypothetical protein
MCAIEESLQQATGRLAPTRAATRKRKAGLGTPLPTQV